MLHIREDPIHCIGDKCVYPSKRNIEHLPKLHNYNDLYGAEDYSKGRFKDLGIPVFVLKFSVKCYLFVSVAIFLDIFCFFLKFRNGSVTGP